MVFGRPRELTQQQAMLQMKEQLSYAAGKSRDEEFSRAEIKVKKKLQDLETCLSSKAQDSYAQISSRRSRLE